MRKSNQFVMRKISGQNLLLSLQPGVEGLWLFELNDTSAYLWEQMEGEFDEQTLSRKLESQFDVDSATALDDVRGLLNELKSFGAVVGGTG